MTGKIGIKPRFRDRGRPENMGDKVGNFGKKIDVAGFEIKSRTKPLPEEKRGLY